MESDAHALLSGPRSPKSWISGDRSGCGAKYEAVGPFFTPGVSETQSPADIALHRTLSNQETREIAAGIIRQILSVETRQA
jgi:hypothetical protein